MQLTQLRRFSGEIELLTGLHIGSGNNEMHIGGTDSPVIKHPHTNEPYIPGSSLKGKMRSMLEWDCGLVQSHGKPCEFYDALPGKPNAEKGRLILTLFGGGPPSNPNPDLEKLIGEIGPSRLAFWDCPLNEHWKKTIIERDLLRTETKMENAINRVTSVAIAPRTIERVPAGAKFNFQLSWRQHQGDNIAELETILRRGFQLLELTGIGGSGSRGYGKIRFHPLAFEGQDWTIQTQSSAAAARA